MSLRPGGPPTRRRGLQLLAGERDSGTASFRHRRTQKQVSQKAQKGRMNNSITRLFWSEALH